MARKHTLKLRELRTIRTRFVVILGGMAAVTVMILAYLAIRVFLLTEEKIEYLDFFSLCFYGSASLAMTIAQIAILRQLTVGAGRRIEEFAFTDELTGLGNRRYIARFLSEEFREAQLSGNPLSLLFVDLDDFKQVNEGHGHKAGDLILRAAGHAFKEAVREADFVGRAGGDEFVVILPDTDSQCASVVADRVGERLAAISVTVDSTVISGVTASVGISAYPANANNRKALVEDADRAMFAAKNSGKGTVVISIARPAGPEPRATVRHITTFASAIADVVDHTKQENAPAQQAALEESPDG